MDRSDHLRMLSEERSGVMTKSVNVFDQTVRQIRCVKKTHDYLGDGSLFTEEELQEIINGGRSSTNVVYKKLPIGKKLMKIIQNTKNDERKEEEQG